MRTLLVIAALLIAMPATAQVDELFTDGDPINSAVYVDGVYKLGKEAYLDLDEMGLKRYHYRVVISFVSVNGRDGIGLSYSFELGTPSGLDHPSDTWEDVFTEKQWEFPRWVKEITDVSVEATRRDHGVDTLEDSVSDMKGRY